MQVLSEFVSQGLYYSRASRWLGYVVAPSSSWPAQMLGMHAEFGQHRPTWPSRPTIANVMPNLPDSACDFIEPRAELARDWIDHDEGS